MIAAARTGTPADVERAMSHGFVRDSLQLEDMELAEWFDKTGKTWISPSTGTWSSFPGSPWPRTAEPLTTAARSP